MNLALFQLSYPDLGTTNEENRPIIINDTAINTTLLDPKWYWFTSSTKDSRPIALNQFLETKLSIGIVILRKIKAGDRP